MKIDETEQNDRTRISQLEIIRIYEKTKKRFAFFSSNYFDTHKLTIWAQNTCTASHNHDKKSKNC